MSPGAAWEPPVIESQPVRDTTVRVIPALEDGTVEVPVNGTPDA